MELSLALALEHRRVPRSDTVVLAGGWSKYISNLLPRSIQVATDAAEEDQDALRDVLDLRLWSTCGKHLEELQR